MNFEKERGFDLMKWLRNILVAIGVVTAIAAAVAGVFVILERKKDDEELEHYLDCSIQ